MLTFHLLTTVTRTENLSTIAYAVEAAQAALDKVGAVIHWHIVFDTALSGPGGYRHKNAVLDSIIPPDGEEDRHWVLVLDDDTVRHVDEWLGIVMSIRANPDALGVIVSERRPRGHVLHAAPQNMLVGYIDIHQYVVRRDFIGDRRFGYEYTSDGEFIVELYRSAPESFVFEPGVVTNFNLLR